MRAPPEVDQPNDRNTITQGEIHYPADFVTLHFAERPAVNGKILCIDVDGAPIDLPITGYHSIAGDAFGSHAHLIAALGNERFQFIKCACIEENIQALPCGQFTFCMLGLNSLGATTLACLGAHFPQLENSRIFIGHTVELPVCTVLVPIFTLLL